MIDIAKLSLPNIPSDSIKFESLEVYRKTAIKLINTVGPRLHPMVASQIMADEDAIDNIVMAVITADWKWDGKGSKYGYRKQCVIWAIKSYMTRRKKSQTVYSLDQPTEEYVVDERGHTLAEVVPSCQPSPVEEASQAELLVKLKEVLQTNCLSDIQKQCIQYKYFEGLSLRTISSKVGMSYQMVSNHINIALAKLRKVL